MTLTEAFLACLGLLLTPGPTNTLLALASASDGRRAAWPLMGAEVAGYLVTVVPMLLFGHILLTAAPEAGTVLRLVAGAWVAWLALSLWRLPQGAQGGAISFRRVFTTTVLNPKGLLLGLGILPSVQGHAPGVVLGVFVSSILIAASTWICLGGLVQGARTGMLRRGAAVVLAGLSVMLLQSGVARIV